MHRLLRKPALEANFEMREESCKVWDVENKSHRVPRNQPPIASKLLPSLYLDVLSLRGMISVRLHRSGDDRVKICEESSEQLSCEFHGSTICHSIPRYLLQTYNVMDMSPQFRWDWDRSGSSSALDPRLCQDLAQIESSSLNDDGD